MLACGAAFGASQGAFKLFGGRIDSFKKEDDEFLRKETVRRTTRLPVEQTVAEVGEGRGKFCFPRCSATVQLPGYICECVADQVDHTGIRPPGYEERRRERIKEKYGFEIDPVKATVDGSE